MSHLEPYISILNLSYITSHISYHIISHYKASTELKQETKKTSILLQAKEMLNREESVNTPRKAVLSFYTTGFPAIPSLNIHISPGTTLHFYYRTVYSFSSSARIFSPLARAASMSPTTAEKVNF